MRSGLNGTLSAHVSAASVSVLGVRIAVLNANEVLEELLGLIQDDRPHSVYIVNAATINLAYDDPEYRASLNRGHIVLNDGTGVRWAARRRGVILCDNHVGTDLVPRLCAARRARVFMLGGAADVAERAAARLAAVCRGVEIVGCHHGFVGAADDERMCALINDAMPDVILVAMGNPRQELWIDRNLHRLRRGTAIGVGGLFDQLAGNLRRAPLWVRRAGIEWTQILLQQPHKWRRYLLGNPVFVLRMLLDRPTGIET